jgi:RNA polymerase sigma-70 factor (ECF subfamily)
MSPEMLLRHAGFVRRIARGLLHDAHLADDVCQATLTEALERPPRDTRNLKGWLGVVARNIALRRRWRARLRKERERRSARPEASAPLDEAVAEMELVRRIAAEVADLDEPYRTVVVERFYHDRKPAEIARRTEVPVATVKTRLQRALAQLRARLDREHGRAAWTAALLPLAWPDGAAAAAVTILTGKKLLAAAAVLALAAVGIVWMTSQSRQERLRPEFAHVVEEDAPTPQESANAAAPPGDTSKGARTSHVFAGQVIDEAGEPVAGARVELFYLLELESSRFGVRLWHLLRRAREQRRRPAVTADAAGRFRFVRPYASISCLRATARGYAPAVTSAHEPASDLEIVLPRTRGLSVRVQDDQGKPVADARVTLMSGSFPGGPRWQTVSISGRQADGGPSIRHGTRLRHTLDEGRTDAAGEVRLLRPPTAELGLEVAPREARFGAVRRNCPADAEVVRVTVPTVPTRRVRLVDADTGAPLSRGYLVAVLETVNSRSLPEIPHRILRADTDGWVEEFWQKGWRIHATAPGYEWKFGMGEPVRLRKAMRVDGRVFDPDGRPLPDVLILVAMESTVFQRSGVGLPVVAASSDAEGRFGFDLKQIEPYNLPTPPNPGMRTLVAVHPRYPPAFLDSLRVEPGGRAGVELRFARPGSLSVEVKDAQGRPLAGEGVWVARIDPVDLSWTGRGEPEGHVPSAFAEREEPQTNANGRATIAELSPGRYRIRVRRAETEASVREGQRTVARVQIGTGLAIEGQLLDRQGKPLPNRQLSFYGPSSGSGQSEADGRFRLLDLKPGKYTIDVNLPIGPMKFLARAGETVVLREPAGKARLRLEVNGPPPGSVEYSLTTESGSDVPQGEKFLPLTAPDYLTKEFLPGRGVLCVRASGHAWRAVRFEAQELTTTTVALDLPKAGAVTGKVAGLPEGNWLVRADPVDDLLEQLVTESPNLAHGITRWFFGWDWWTGVQPDGTFEIANLTPGRWRVRVGHQPNGPGFVDRVTKEIEVHPGQTTRVKLEAAAR